MRHKNKRIRNKVARNERKVIKKDKRDSRKKNPIKNDILKVIYISSFFCPYSTSHFGTSSPLILEGGDPYFVDFMPKIKKDETFWLK
jgi:hypothetical protein